MKSARLVIHNMVVCMRQGRNSPLIAILNEFDINGIVSKYTSGNTTTVNNAGYLNSQSSAWGCTKQITVRHINVNRLKWYFNLIEACIFDDEYDFFAISKTFLRGIDSDDLIALGRYTFFRNGRKKKKMTA